MMQYMGGKHALAREIATEIERRRGGRPVLEPFCGALNVTAALSGARFACDIHPGLIALYQLLQRDPDALNGLSHVTDAEYAYYRTLPDGNPVKAAVGFGCSFGGKWFGGLARQGEYDFAAACVRSLRRKIAACADVEFACASFFDIAPMHGWCVYMDPPYAGTTDYRDAFPYAAFVARVMAWADAGSTVLVSEYSFPIGCVVWEKDRAPRLSAGVNGRAKRKVDRLFLIEPTNSATSTGLGRR